MSWSPRIRALAPTCFVCVFVRHTRAEDRKGDEDEVKMAKRRVQETKKKGGSIERERERGRLRLCGDARELRSERGVGAAGPDVQREASLSRERERERARVLSREHPLSKSRVFTETNDQCRVSFQCVSTHHQTERARNGIFDESSRVSLSLSLSGRSGLGRVS